MATLCPTEPKAKVTFSPVVSPHAAIARRDVAPVTLKLRDIGIYLLAFEWMTLVNASKLVRFANRVLNGCAVNR